MKAVLYFIFSILSGVCFAQTSGSHKTYSGPFPDSHSAGKATCSYLTAESGERIFDGHFKYTFPFGESLEGDFKNNRQVGKWVRIWPNNAGGPQALVKTVTTANFGENGYLDGSFKIQKYYRNGTVIAELDATYRNGRLNGPFKGEVEEGDFSGQYKDNKPVGVWKYSWLEFPVDFDKADEYGNVMVKRVEAATGDISEAYEEMPIYPGGYKGNEWWLKEILMRDSRRVVFHPSFPFESRSSESGRFEGMRDGGLEQVSVESGLEITIPKDCLNDREFRGGWSDWEDYLIRNFNPDIDEIGQSPVTIHLLLEIGSDGRVGLIEKDDRVSDVLNNETLRLLQKLQWVFGYGRFGIIEERVKPGVRAFCIVDVTFDPARMKSNLKVFNEKKQKKQKEIEAAKQYEESFSPIGERIHYKRTSNELDDDDKIYDKLQEMPQFPGGSAGLAQFLRENVKYPQSAQGNGVSGIVFVGFVVRKDGSVTDGKIIRGRGNELDKEALRIVRFLPKFKPGRLNGKPVNCRVTIPIAFRLGS